MGTPVDARTDENGLPVTVVHHIQLEVGYKEAVSYNSETGTYKHKVNGLSDVPHTRRRVFEWNGLLGSLLIRWG